MQFGGEEIVVISQTMVSCPRKKVRVFLPWLREFMETKKTKIVGVSMDETLPQDKRMLEARFETGFIHLGCLHETVENGTRIYQELIKHVNKVYGKENQLS